MRLQLLTAVSVLALAACSAPPPPTQAPSTPPEPATAPAPTAAPAATAPAAPAAEATEAVPAEFQVRTNEPFWSARVQGDTLVLTSPDGERTLKVESNTATANGRDVTASDATGSVKVHVTNQPCQDTMSEESFPFTGTLTVGDAAPASGCGLLLNTPPSGA